MEGFRPASALLSPRQKRLTCKEVSLALMADVTTSESPELEDQEESAPSWSNSSLPSSYLRQNSLKRAATDMSTSTASDDNTSSDEMIEKLGAHQRRLLYLLVFDAWPNLLTSFAGTQLCNQLAAGASAEQRLAQKISSCVGSLPKDTDEWMRLFISTVQDLELIGVCISDLSLGQAPIIYTNTGFQAMTGYSLDESVGRSCRFLQGPQSDPAAVETIVEAIRTGTQAHVRLLNYRKDGNVFNNMLSLRPIFDREGHLVFMVSISVEVVEQFSRLKPLLAQADRLNKLLPERIPLPSPPSVHERVSLIHGNMLLVNRAQMAERLAKVNASEKGSREAAAVIKKLVPTGVKRSQERVAAFKAAQAASQAKLESAHALQRSRNTVKPRPSSSFAPPTAPPTAPRLRRDVSSSSSSPVTSPSMTRRNLSDMPPIDRPRPTTAERWPSHAAGVEVIAIRRASISPGSSQSPPTRRSSPNITLSPKLSSLPKDSRPSSESSKSASSSQRVGDLSDALLPPPPPASRARPSTATPRSPRRPNTSSGNRSKPEGGVQ